MREEGSTEPGTALLQHSAGPSAFPSGQAGVENAAPSLDLDGRSGFMLRHVPLVFTRMCDLGQVMGFWDLPFPYLYNGAIMASLS